nr:hypothetical protein NCPCFENI_00781 [Cupriavidus sp.]
MFEQLALSAGKTQRGFNALGLAVLHELHKERR